MAWHNVIYIKAWCARDNPLDGLYQVHEIELMGFGVGASLPKVNFQISKAWRYIRASFDTIRESSSK